MKFSAIASVLLGASAAVAAPGTEARRQRARQTAMARKTNPKISSDSSLAAAEATNNTHVEYSQNWAGAVLIGEGYTSVTGTFTVPEPSVPSGGSSSTTYSSSAWVGIDGDTCQTSIIQTGVDFTVRGTQTSFDAWYEWYPDYAYEFTGISISAGDSIRTTVTASSTSAGVATIENLTTGQTVSHSFSGETNQLCEQNAEWIVEDYTSGNSLVPLADFGTVVFTDATATTGGSTVGPGDSTIIDMEQNGEILTSCSATDSTVTCTYI